MTSRREFFRKVNPHIKEDVSLVIRPPYGLDDLLFQTGCITCESKACVSACEEEIIMIDENQTPTLDFSQKGCTFCDACAVACDKGVLSVEHAHTSEKINANFMISLDTCVAHHEVICFSCKEPCIDDAILFNGMFNPVIDMNLCTACGYCVGRCPTEAITYTPTIMIKEG